VQLDCQEEAVTELVLRQSAGNGPSRETIISQSINAHKSPRSTAPKDHLGMEYSDTKRSSTNPEVSSRLVQPEQQTGVTRVDRALRLAMRGSYPMGVSHSAIRLPDATRFLIRSSRSLAEP
jgi:hypothetical protein